MRYLWNCISDAEQLPCLLYPATELETLVLDQPEAVAGDVASALDVLGDPRSIPRRIVDILADYLARYTSEGGEPIFAAGSYLRTAWQDDGPDAAGPRQVTEEQLALGVIDAYARSVTLCLAVLGFIRVYRHPNALADRVGRVERGYRDRLTCAMIGLLRSFTVSTTVPGELAHSAMLQLMNQRQTPDEIVLEQLRSRLNRVRARLRDDVRIGVDSGKEVALNQPDALFACGWSWGITRSAPPARMHLEVANRTVQPEIAGPASRKASLNPAIRWRVDERRSASNGVLHSLVNGVIRFGGWVVRGVGRHRVRLVWRVRGGRGPGR